MQTHDIRERLQAILDGVKRLRASYYPPDYSMDSWYKVQQELEALLVDLGRGPASAP